MNQIKNKWFYWTGFPSFSCVITLFANRKRTEIIKGHVHRLIECILLTSWHTATSLYS